ncbi:dipeptidyl-aminopeptidase B [Physcia stellaris]|nr:dipeptidyl-aminopeptidase B [Physcia stellaris]
MIERYRKPFLIGLSPVVLITGIFVLLIFGFTIALAVIVSIFLQTPEDEGGYGFSPLQNSIFNFAHWLGLAVCLICGIVLGDRLPLWVSHRSGSTWHPEYRLYNIFIVVLAAPIGFGIFGAGIQYHLHYMVLALGTFLVIFAACFSTPITVNYIAECFKGSVIEVAIVMNVYRQALGLALPFFIFPWQSRVGSGCLTREETEDGVKVFGESEGSTKA